MKHRQHAKRAAEPDRHKRPVSMSLGAETKAEKCPISDARLRESSVGSRKWRKYMQNKCFAHILAKHITDEISRLLCRLDELQPGHENADTFKKLVAEVFDFVFDGDLKRVGIESELHGGMKRIDIVYRKKSKNVPLLRADSCPFIPVECKNYNVDPSNPEIDQLLGRFSDKRGRLGFLVCNKIINRRRLLLRCRQSCQEQHACIIVLDRDDLRDLLIAKHLAIVFKEPDRVPDLLYVQYAKAVY